MKFFTEERDGPVRDALAAQVAGWPQVTQKKMMGCACFWADGKMFAFVANGCLVLTRLTAEERRKLPGEDFFTGAGRAPIRKWRQVRIDAPTDVEDLKPWVRACYERALEAADDD